MNPTHVAESLQCLSPMEALIRCEGEGHETPGKENKCYDGGRVVTSPDSKVRQLGFKCLGSAASLLCDLGHAYSLTSLGLFLICKRGHNNITYPNRLLEGLSELRNKVLKSVTDIHSNVMYLALGKLEREVYTVSLRA